ncbi:histone deacetylase 4 [Brachyhypopomus gauderio]|uniref:histone deacetylase 4 n=1 Tax=Brachyhypopomus gauderio TaxID=698409 RepID=UPI0040434DF5
MSSHTHPDGLPTKEQPLELLKPSGLNHIPSVDVSAALPLSVPPAAIPMDLRVDPHHVAPAPPPPGRPGPAGAAVAARAPGAEAPAADPTTASHRRVPAAARAAVTPARGPAPGTHQASAGVVGSEASAGVVGPPA